MTYFRNVVFFWCLVLLVGAAPFVETGSPANAQQCPNGHCPPD